MNLPLKPNQRMFGRMPNSVKFRLGAPNILGNYPVEMVFPNGKVLTGLIATPAAVEQLKQLSHKQEIPQIITPRGV